MKPVISIGAQDFGKIRENKSFYIDKTAFISEWWENQDDATLITRPRRFGKTLNMSMLEYFFSSQYAGRADLFRGLAIWKYEKYRSLQGKYPVISLSFAGIKGDVYETVREGIIQIILDLYVKYGFLQQGNRLSPQEKEYFVMIRPDMTDAAAAMALYRLSICMYRYYGEKVIILLDEYDTPLQEAYAYGFWEKMAGFVGRLFHFTFKANPYMQRGLMTGITRVGKESIFSDMNNLEVVTTTSRKYETAFGFTEKEVANALAVFGMSENFEKVKFWYDGFHFGGQRDIYNPWSITKYLDRGKFGTYWINTSSNRLAEKLIREGMPDIKIAAEDLLLGRSIAVALDEEVVFGNLDENMETVWGLLLASGYLKVDAVSEGEDEGEDIYHLSLTNLEVKKEFEKMIQRWFRNCTIRYNDFIKALLADDIENMNRYMSQVALRTFSSFDVGKKPAAQAEPERFYHGFVLGLMVDLADRYRITSNRESGLGRYDVMLEPLQENLCAAILEFKVYNPTKEKNLEETVKNALIQIKEKKYDAELMARGIAKENIHYYGFAFAGKEVLIG